MEVEPLGRLALAAALTVAFVLPGCGGDDTDGARRAVRDFVRATNQRDGGKLCGDLLTTEYMEKATGAEGDQAERSCERQLRLVKGLHLDLISVGHTSVDGDVATVHAVIATGGQKLPRVFALRKEDGRWKLLGGSSERAQ